MRIAAAVCFASLILSFPTAAQQESLSPQRIRVFVASGRMVDGNLEFVTHTQGVVGLIRFGGHLPKGEYDVDHDGHEGQADAAELHG